MPGGGTLTIRSRQQEGRTVLEFQDTGAGIPAAELGRIFDPLRLDRERGRNAGLAVSLGIGRRLGGSLRAESEPGKGTTFFVTLPLPGPTAAA